MSNKSKLILILLAVAINASGQGVGSQITFTLGTTPGNPAAGKVRLWGNSATGHLECLTSGGTACGLDLSKQDIMDAPSFCVDAGVTDAYACNLSPAITAYVTGTHYRFKANTANTGTATVAFNGLASPKTIVKVAGGVTTALADNDIRAGQWVDLVYDGTNMQMQSTLGNAGGGGSPGGSANQYQYNDSGTTFAGSGILSYDGTNRRNVMDRAGISFTSVAAPSAPTAALITAAGNVDNGDHQYCMTYATAQGETECSPQSNVVTTDASHGQVTLSGLGNTCPTGGTGKNLYRTCVGCGNYAAQLPSMPLACATATLLDNTSDGSLDYAHISSNVNTTAGGINSSGLLSNHTRLGNLGAAIDAALDSGIGYVYDASFYGAAPALSEGFFELEVVGEDNSPASTRSIAGISASANSSGTGNYGTVTGISSFAYAGNSGTSGDVVAGAFEPRGAGATTGKVIAIVPKPVVYTGTITTLSGIRSEAYQYGGAVTTFTNVDLPGMHKTGGTLTNAYQLLIGGITEASNNWAIKTGLGKVDLGDVLILNRDVANPLQMIKGTQSAAAPGAGYCSFEVRAGTNAGTGKLVMYCGTSATGVTIVDNVGAGF